MDTGGFCTTFVGVQFIRPELRNSPAKGVVESAF
jgi:hypothetical protein